MTISELRLALDLSFENKADVLKRYAKQMSNKKYLFADSSDGSCHLFDRDGNEDDITKLDCIENALFYSDKSLTLITIPDSVTSIRFSAFEDCSGLTSVTIPDSVTSIGDFAFYGCSGLMSVTIPDGVMSIGYLAFLNCNSLKELIFKGKTTREVKAIEDYPLCGIKDESIIKCES